MKRFLHSLLFSFFLIAIAGTVPAWAARGGGGGGHGGGGHAGGGWHGGGGFHGHSGHGHGSHVTFGFGLGVWGGPWYPYGWPYYYPAYSPYPAYSSYYDAPVYYSSAADGYASADYPAASAQPREAPAWYYCASLKGYYPYVSECPEQWQRVPTVPPPGSDNRRRSD